MKYIIILLTSLFLVSNSSAHKKEYNEWVVAEVRVYNSSSVFFGDPPDVQLFHWETRKECEDHVLAFANSDDYKKRGVVLSYDNRERPYLSVTLNNGEDTLHMYCKPAF
tara:strand:- start:1097 stop:1423 length:327 start_codon:yes stop_codon:yes gene_type:complete